MMGVPLAWYLILAAALFCVGLYGVLSRRNAIATVMGVELMLNAVNVNLLAFWRYTEPGGMTGQAFATFVYAVAAAEVAVGLALIVAIYRNRDTVDLDQINLLKW
jgi:NADH:ubiquinone oxidoreductase subunit K